MSSLHPTSIFILVSLIFYPGLVLTVAHGEMRNTIPKKKKRTVSSSVYFSTLGVLLGGESLTNHDEIPKEASVNPLCLGFPM